MNQELIPIENPNVPELFVAGGLDEIINRIQDEALSVVADGQTEAGREELKRVARRVASSKTYLEGLGKDYAAALKQKGKEVDAVRRDMRQRLDAVRDRVRAPVTEWEEAEAHRQQHHRDGIARLLSFCDGLENADAAECNRRLSALRETVVDDRWDEFQDEAGKVRDATAYRVRTRLDELLAQEEERRKAQAEAKARAEAERAALEQRLREQAEVKAKADAAARIAAAEKAKADAERRAAEALRLAAQREREAREREAREAVRRQEAATQAVAQERARLKTLAAEAERARQCRLGDEARCNQARRVAAADIADIVGIDFDDALLVVEAIADGRIQHLAMNP